MGNAIGGKRRRTARVMTVDGTTYKYRPPAAAAAALRDHPGYQLLESEDVRRLGVRARPLDDDAPLKPGRLYFLVALPRLARAPRRTWSGPLLHVGDAGERLERLMLSSRRSASDMAAAVMVASPRCSSVEAAADGAVRLRMRLPKADVARLLEESRRRRREDHAALHRQRSPLGAGHALAAAPPADAGARLVGQEARRRRRQEREEGKVRGRARRNHLVLIRRDHPSSIVTVLRPLPHCRRSI